MPDMVHLIILNKATFIYTEEKNKNDKGILDKCNYLADFLFPLNIGHSGELDHRAEEI